MGLCNLADVLTDLCLTEHEDAVAFIICQTEGGYPKAEANRARTGRFFSDICQIVSLPIHCKMGGYSEIEPLENQLSVELAVKMFELENWEQVLSGPLNWQSGGKIAQNKRLSKLFGKNEKENETYGLCVVSKSSWNFLMDFSSKYENKKNDVDQVFNSVKISAEKLLETSAKRKQNDFKSKEEMHASDLEFMNLMNILDLCTRTYVGKDGERIDAPRIAYILSTSEERAISYDFARWLNGEQGMFGIGNAKNILSRSENIKECLEQLWDLKAFETAMSYHNKTLLSSSSVGQHLDDAAQIELSLLTIKQASQRIIVDCDDNGEITSQGEKLIEVTDKLESLAKDIQINFDNKKLPQRNF